MNVLLVHNRYLQRGGEDGCVELEQRLLRAHGHRVDTYEESNERVEQLGPLRTAARTIWSGESFQRIRRRLRERRYDVVQVHNFFPLVSPAVYHAARSAGVPVVQTLHNFRLICPGSLLFRDGKICTDCLGRAAPLPAIGHACYRGSRAGSAAVAGMITTHRLLGTWDRMVDRYVALTQFQRRTLIQGGLPADRIVVKPNAVEHDPGPGEHGGDYALFVGRLSPEKGVATLVEAWRHVTSVPLKVVGTGPLEGEARRAASELASVEYLGGRSRDDVLALMKEARFLVVPSLWYEAFPMVIAEAFAVGLPVIASDLGSLAEIVEHGRTGRLSRPGDPASLAEQVQAAWGDPSRTAEMGRAARREYEEKYTPEQYVRRLVEIYGTLKRASAA
jgi:glycosyltransferase involved in cell wall biosynthesis